jgi:hypothetical protein
MGFAALDNGSIPKKSSNLRESLAETKKGCSPRVPNDNECELRWWRALLSRKKERPNFFSVKKFGAVCALF